MKKINSKIRWINRQGYLSIALLPFLVYSAATKAIVKDAEGINLVNQITGQVIEHCDNAIATGNFVTIFVCGDELFDFKFNAADGGGSQRWRRWPLYTTAQSRPEWVR